ncbi:hypothetical protein tinsulaeT_19300 [Thalassotalea insulae]|uniref:Uncharacterized protein n=1 Tax=Thalassotalea insulae TaxID=2056778 RepID=A0ABQ6GV96_9GAMM|nr:hypothetical protein tinsulaeT_19300 [Thalassotalea insulae]
MILNIGCLLSSSVSASLKVIFAARRLYEHVEVNHNIQSSWFMVTLLLVHEF